MAADVITPAIIRYIDHHEYPDDETISSSDLTTATLQSLNQELRKAQDDVKAEVREISRDASSDIDTWILRAKELQADILRSRETARAIVEEAERGRELKAKVEDKKRKVELLEREVKFQETVGARLEHVRRAREILGSVQDQIVSGDVLAASKQLEEAEESIRGLGASEDGGVATVLGRRTEQLRERLQEMVTQGWEDKLVVDIEGRKVTIKDGIDDLVTTAKSLGLFDGALAKFVREFERAILRPRMSIDRNGRAPVIHASAGQLVCSGSSEEADLGLMIADLNSTIDFLHDHLPVSIAIPLSELLMPPTISRLEEDWLQPAIPLEIADMPEFQQVLGKVSGFAERISERKWHGDKPLVDWVQGAARSWLTKRRESLLGDVRNLVFTGLKETKIVERVETQMINNDDSLAQGGDNAEEEWDTAWDEPEETHNIQARNAPAATEDDDEEASAWGLPGDEEESKEEGNEEDDAWGWGDGAEGASEQPPSPQNSKKAQPVPNGQRAAHPSQQEVTLRESFTVTAIPDGILKLMQQIITDAEALAQPEYAASAIAPAAMGLYSLPTLALAIYRATAPTAYSKLATGNMLIYNDTNRLSDQLRAWQASQPPASRLRLDNDVKALDQFAKRAYSGEMESQRTVLRDLLDGAQGFSNCTTHPFQGECESAVEQTVDRLRDVYKQWQPILSNGALLQSIGSLLATVTGKMITEIEDLPDIGEAESKELKVLCDIVTSAKDLFAQQNNNADGEIRDMTFIYCPNWLKFQYLAEIMESSLADIKYLWRDTEMSLDFEAEEVVGLIEALFAESTLRRQAILEIRRR